MDEITAMIQSNFNKVFEKINELNKRIDRLEGPQKTIPISKSEPAPRPKEPELLQRTGQYCSADVSLDKVFYFGKK